MSALPIANRYNLVLMLMLIAHSHSHSHSLKNSTHIQNNTSNTRLYLHEKCWTEIRKTTEDVQEKEKPKSRFRSKARQSKVIPEVKRQGKNDGRSLCLSLSIG